MPTKLCTREDVIDWLSTEGIVTREDDDRSGVAEAAETDRTDRIIEKASSRVSAYLSQRYKFAQYAGSGTPPTNTPPIVRHWAAVFAAYMVCIRRNLPISAELSGAYKEALEELKLISTGAGGISLPEVGDDLESIPTVTNYHIDGSYRSNKARVVAESSTGKRPTPPIKNNQENRGYTGLFE